MKYVIDASFVAALFLPDEESERAAALGRGLVREAAAAPALLQFEFMNILLMAERRKRISGLQLKQLAESFQVLPIVFQPPLTPLQSVDVIALAQKHQLTAYDAAYLELAMRATSQLASLDKSLLAAAKAEGVAMAL